MIDSNPLHSIVLEPARVMCTWRADSSPATGPELQSPPPQRARAPGECREAHVHREPITELQQKPLTGRKNDGCLIPLHPYLMIA